MAKQRKGGKEEFSIHRVEPKHLPLRANKPQVSLQCSDCVNTWNLATVQPLLSDQEAGCHKPTMLTCGKKKPLIQYTAGGPFATQS